MIGKLKKNVTVHGELSDEERACFAKVGKENCEYRGGDGWEGAAHISSLIGVFGLPSTYRIKADYQPEPATPVFEGYVVVEAGWKSDTEQIIKNYQGNDQQFDGYVFKEWPDSRFNVPIMFIGHSGGYAYEGREGFKPATLRWVVFKDDKEKP